MSNRPLEPRRSCGICSGWTRLDTLSPHPVYAWMGWAQILSPTAARFDELRPLLAESLALVRHKWKRRVA
jgi:hypothetical protein